MKKKTRILFINNDLYNGGAEKILQTLLSQLDENKYDITLYSVMFNVLDTTLFSKTIKYKTVFSGTSKKSYFNNLIVKIKNKIKLYIYNHLSAKIFYKLFIKGVYDVEVAFIEGYSTKIVSGSHHKSIKIAWAHIDLEANHWTKIAYKNIDDEISAYKKFDKIVSVSKSVKDAFARKFGHHDKLTVKYNPVNRDEICTKSLDLIEPSSSKLSQTNLITVGRLEPQKGYDRLIKVLARLRDDNFDFNLKILGEGTKRKELEDLIETFNLKDKVTLLGFQSNPYKFIKSADLFVCSSRSEGFSTVVTEALILGKPVVATDCSGMTELLGDSEYGLITKNNEESLYLGMKKILSDAKLMNHYQQKSEERSQDFDIKKTVLEVEKLWL